MRRAHEVLRLRRQLRLQPGQRHRLLRRPAHERLSRLFTAAAQNGFVINGTTSAAFQAGIWEIIYEQDAGYSFLTGTIEGAVEDPANQAAFNTVNGFLLNLGQYAANYKIDVLTNNVAQDFLVATIPEPETWALLGAGLGVIGLLRRRCKT